MWLLSLFKKKKYIDTNPPARDIALANRRKKRVSGINNQYRDILKQVNNAIDNGNLSITLNFEYNSNMRRYYNQDVITYLAARRLRARGFSVRLTKRHPYPKATETAVFVPYSYRYYNKGLIISWK